MRMQSVRVRRSAAEPLSRGLLRIGTSPGHGGRSLSNRARDSHLDAAYACQSMSCDPFGRQHEIAAPEPWRANRTDRTQPASRTSPTRSDEGGMQC